ncbi:MAG: hypothetical protein HY560_10635 [Gemmatimonadetes bacterium]|nr:hypothetical protein [Gemmatimonadota bacterium]
MTRRRSLVLGVTLAVLAASCKEGPVAGELAVNLTTPNSDDGAIQFAATAVTPNTISGITSACSGCKLFVQKVSDTEYKGVVTGDLTAGTLFRVGVSDTKAEMVYAVQVVAVSSRTFVLRSQSGYSVALAK